jgi:hypothetical protein
VALAAEEFAQLIESMGLAGTAAANYESILARLTAAQNAAAAAEKIAAATGTTAAQVRASLAAANKEAADTEARLAAEQQRAAAAAERAEAAAARQAIAVEAAAERAAAAMERSAERKAAAAAREQAAAEAAAARDAAATERKAAAEERAAVRGQAAAQKAAAQQAEAAAKQQTATTQATSGQQKFAASLMQSAASGTRVNGVVGALQDALSKLGPAGQLAAIAIGVVVKVATAAAEALWGLVKAAVAISQEKDALAATFDAVGSGAESGVDTVNRLSDAAGRLGIGEEKVLRWGKAMAAVGKEGDALVRSVSAIGASAAIMRDNGEAALAFSKRLQAAADAGEKLKLDRRMERMLAETGVRASELAKILGMPAENMSKLSIDAAKLGDAFETALIAKGGGALNKMSLTWESISGKLKDAWEDLFEDLGPAVEPLMTAIRDLFSEFGVGTTIQGAAKGALTSFFTTLFGWATRAISVLHVVFLEIQIGALRAYIFLAPLIKIFVAIYTNAFLLRGVKTILLAVAIAAGVVVAGLASMAAIVGAVGAAFVTVGSLIWSAILSIIGAVQGLVEAFLTGGTQGAANFISGLVQGISNGASEVVNAVKNMASSAEAAFTSFFEIKSPSRKMKRHGRQLPAGAAEGADEGAIQLEKSLDDIWRVPTKAGGGRRGGRGRLAETVNFYFQGRKDDFDDFRASMEKWLDQQEASGPEPESA